MAKYAIINSGNAKTGKTASMLIILDKLLKEFNIINILYKRSKHRDKGYIIEIDKKNKAGDNIKIGIETVGDPATIHPTSIQRFLKYNCDIILLACRESDDFGETKSNIYQLKELYNFIWTSNPKSFINKDKSLPNNTRNKVHKELQNKIQNEVNEIYANSIIELVKKLINKV